MSNKYIVRHYMPGGGDTTVRHSTARAAKRQIYRWIKTGVKSGSIVAYGPRKNREGNYEIARVDLPARPAARSRGEGQS